MTRLITQSELSSFTRCKRKWYLSYYRHLRKRRYEGSAPLDIGTLVHAGLEAWYRPTDQRHPLDAIRDTTQGMLDKFPDAAAEILKHAELAGVMIEGYMQWLEDEGADADLDVYAAEKRVEVPVGSFRLLGKLDAAAVRKSDGLRLQLEHKTVGNLSDLPKVAQVNFQYLTYDLLAHLKALEDGDSSVRTDGVLLNMLRKVKRTNAKPPFYGRHPVRHNLEELRNHWRHVISIAEEAERARARLDGGETHHAVVPPRPSRDCSWDCPFYAVCGPGHLDDGSDSEGMLNALYEEHDPLERYG